MNKILLFVLLLAFTACNLADTADARFDGAWIAVSRVRLEFRNGTYIRTSAEGVSERGTFTVNGDDITFFRTGFSPETLPFILNGNELIIGAITYYRDIDVKPERLEVWNEETGAYEMGRWMWFLDMGVQWVTMTSYQFGPTTPVRGFPNMLEGDVIQHTILRGRYTLRSHALPGNNVLTINITAMNGNHLLMFIQSRFIHLLPLFDDRVREPTGTTTLDTWWFTPQEIQRFFENAAARAATIENRELIIAAMRDYINFIQTPLIFYYTLEFDPELRRNHRIARDDVPNRLTLTQRGSTVPLSYFLVDETSWDFEYIPVLPPPVNKIELDPSGLVSGPFGEIMEGVDVTRGSSRNFTAFLTWDSAFDDADIDIYWVVSPYDWDELPHGSVLHPDTRMIVTGTNFPCGTNSVTATLEVSPGEQFSALMVHVFAFKDDGQSSASVRVNIR